MEAFLRFLYSGTLDADVQTLVEVMVIADKYQVKELSSHCDCAATKSHGTCGGVAKCERWLSGLLIQHILVLRHVL